jgi:hypothetical protein
MNRLSILAIGLITVLTVPALLWAKGDMVLIEIKGSDLRSPIKITDSLLITRWRRIQSRWRLVAHISDDSGQFGAWALVVGGEPDVGREQFAVTAMPPALHRCAGLRSLFPSQGMMQLRQEGSDWVADQMSIAGRHQLRSRAIGKFDDWRVQPLLSS